MAGTTFASIASLIAAAAATGTGIYEGVNSSNIASANNAAQKAQLTQEQQAQANQANLSKQEAVLGASGQAQQQTGGSLTDPGTTALTDLLAGYPGFQNGSAAQTNPGTGTSTGTGTSASPTSGSTPGSTDSSSNPIAAILAALRGQGGGAGGSGTPSSISGGNWQTQPAQPQTQFELANPQV